MRRAKRSTAVPQIPAAGEAGPAAALARSEFDPPPLGQVRAQLNSDPRAGRLVSEVDVERVFQRVNVPCPESRSDGDPLAGVVQPGIWRVTTTDGRGAGPSGRAK